MTEQEKKLKDEIAFLFKNARAEGSLRKWEDGVSDAEEVLFLIEEAGYVLRGKKEVIKK